MNEIQTLYFGNEQMYREVLINDYFESMNQENEYIFECISKDLCKTYKFNTTNNLFIEDIDFPLLKKEIKTNILAIGYEYFHFYYSPYFSQQVKFTNYCENGKIFRTIGMELQLMSNFVNENECPKDDYSSFSIEIESKNETIEINSRIYKISVLDNRISDSTPIYLKFTNSYLRVIPNKCFQITNSSSLLFIPGIYGDKNYIFLKEYNSTNNCNGIYGISEFSPDQYSYTKFNINDDYSIISYFDNDYKDCGINKIEEASLIRYVLPDINKCQFKSTYTINEFNLIETKYDNSDCKGNIIIQESYALKRCINDTNQLHIIIATFPIKSEDCNNKFKGCINCDLDECYECPSGYGLSMKKDKCIDCSIFTNDCIQCNNQTCTKCNSIDNEIRVYHNNNCLTCKEAFNDNGCLECNVNNCTLYKNISTSIVVGPFATLNKDVTFGLLLKNVFTSSNMPSFSFKLNLEYSFQPFNDIKLVSTVNYVREVAQNINVECTNGNEFCNVDFSVFKRFGTLTYERFDIFSLSSSSLEKMDQAEFYGTIQTSNSSSTVFEIYWRIFFNWALEQHLTALLIYGLILFNNPFCLLEHITGASFFLMVDSFFESFFTGYLMFYILAVFNSVRRPERAKGFIPLIVRAIMAIIISCSAFGSILSIRMTIQSNSKFHSNTLTIFFSVMFLLSIVIYLFWLLFEVIRSFSERRKMSGSNKNRVVIFGIVTFGCIFLLMAVYVGVYFSGYMVSNMFIGLLAYVNLYCFFVAILNLPSLQKQGSNTNGVNIAKLDTEFKVETYDDDDELVVENKNEEGTLEDSVALN
ncbi:hypothetical protein EHI8A_099600 [Entamoeba histolytica HM-1:IMSS-B]|uniref:Wntless-like transmembrane domain-containing protein n=1 Tax=Entamoeba histolytica HM-1:IMSS-B TaxID=885319 RepID=M3UQ59_ENTH1|nr:hypothetical protein EHI8A_099600 [Entamoeba histolytica HM-1:IMSS-B]